MTLTQLEYIVAVDQYRHFGKAAKECHVTQPTLSMQLQKAEEELGVIFFDRSKNPIIPTKEGELIVKQALVVLKEFGKIKEIVDNSRSDISGDFRLAVIPTLSPYVIPLFVKNFVKLYPKVNLKIQEEQTESIISLLEKDQIDAGILVTPLYNDQIIERVLFIENFFIFTSEESPLYKKSKVKEGDLDPEGLWLLNEGHCLRNQMINLCKMKKKSNLSGFMFESGNLETLKNMVLQGSGYTLLPELAVHNLAPEHEKNIREFSKPIPSREVSLVHSRSFLKEKIINSLEEVIINSLPKEIKTHKQKDVSIIDIN